MLDIGSEHRMLGLLWSWAQDHHDDCPERTWLALHDLRLQQHQLRVARLLEDVVHRLDSIGVQVVTLKGVTAEQRWYRRRGERLCSDVDLWIGPEDLRRMDEILDELSPAHPWRDDIVRLVVSGRIQAVTLRVDGLEVDLHTDLFKLGFASRCGAEYWERAQWIALPGGQRVRVLDETVALLHFLVHLNKDRFQRLLAYADVVRVANSEMVDWNTLERFARAEGLEASVRCTLAAVSADLDWTAPQPVGKCGNCVRCTVWRLLWPPRIRLLGLEGRRRFRRRQQWLSVSARGRLHEGLWWWAMDLFPPSVTVVTRYPDERGPYLWRLISGRVKALIGDWSNNEHAEA